MPIDYIVIEKAANGGYSVRDFEYSNGSRTSWRAALSNEHELLAWLRKELLGEDAPAVCAADLSLVVGRMPDAD